MLDLVLLSLLLHLGDQGVSDVEELCHMLLLLKLLFLQLSKHEVVMGEGPELVVLAVVLPGLGQVEVCQLCVSLIHHQAHLYITNSHLRTKPSLSIIANICLYS